MLSTHVCSPFLWAPVDPSAFCRKEPALVAAVSLFAVAEVLWRSAILRASAMVLYGASFVAVLARDGEEKPSSGDNRKTA